MMPRLVLLVLAGGALLGGCAGGTTLSRARLDGLRSQGVAPDMVYLVDLRGYEPVEQSMSVYNDNGFQTFYLSAEGRQVWFGVDRGAFSDALCRERPVHDAEPPAAPVSCEADDVGWYRVSGGRHEYAVVEDGHVIRLSGLRADVDRATLKEAMSTLQPQTARP
ncbi:hypothetical protein [Sphaerisporangium corydalis]|uniref:DUF4367 domain-containing protein n=1 Tax=Sphaerisporangium corydalis TaxID=1441875 RepID=A0ABV9EJ07_9ACTN|nr:hypothetical protein [Sphaerisporangium corydalis]